MEKNKHKLQLTPLLKSHLETVVKKHQIFLKDMLSSFGSPLNIVLPQALSDNVSAFNKVLEKHNIGYKIFYAHKPNKSKAFVKEAKYAGVNLDVASEAELKSGLAAGFVGNEIEATGPKNKEFLLLAIQHGLLINVDNLDELQQIVMLTKKIQKPCDIILRLTDFASSSTLIKNSASRFGIPITQLTEAWNLLEQCRDLISLKGFSFHLDTSGEKEKIVAIENLITKIIEARAFGYEVDIVNIGGGFKVNYLANEQEWSEYNSVLKQAVLGETDPITWHNTGMGYKSEHGVLRGSPDFYEYYSKVSGANYLDGLLEGKLTKFANRTVAQVLGDLMINLYIEPGRSLLDQAGISLAKVNFVKQSSDGQTLVGLDMNRTNLNFLNQEFFVDPIIISKNPKSANKAKGSAYFVGNLCLEGDFLYKHKSYLDSMPETGDVVIFVNTAGYYMDFSESNTLQQRVADKIAFTITDEKLSWWKDEQYNPFLINI